MNFVLIVKNLDKLLKFSFVDYYILNNRLNKAESENNLRILLLLTAIIFSPPLTFARLVLTGEIHVHSCLQEMV